jgi:hypothetical protein
MANELEDRHSLPAVVAFPLATGGFAGCPYGSGEQRALTGVCDSPICHGSGYEGMITMWVPHADAGDPECLGFLVFRTLGI